MTRDRREDALGFVWRADFQGRLGPSDSVSSGCEGVVGAQEVPGDLEAQGRAVFGPPRGELLRYLAMQMLPRRRRDGIVRLHSDQLVAELQAPAALSQEPLLQQARQRLPRRWGREADHLVERQVGQSPPQHRREVERRPSRPLEPRHLSLEHRGDRPRDPHARRRLGVHGLEIAQQRTRPMRNPLFREQLERQRVAIARLEDARRGNLAAPAPNPAPVPPAPNACGNRPDEPLGRVRAQRLELQPLKCPDRMVGDERARRHRAQLVRAAGENEQHPALRQLARHHVHDRHAGVVRRMQVVGHQHHRTLLRRRLERLEHRVRQPQRDHLGRPLQRPRHPRERLQDLRRHPCQLAQRLRRGAPDRPL